MRPPLGGKPTDLSPERIEAWRNLALAVAQTAGSHAALDVYRQALSHHPRDRDLLYNYGNLCFRRGDLDDAAAAQAALLEAHPQFAAGWINAGMTHKAAGRFEQAADCYRRAIALDDPASSALAHFNLANVLLLQGRWADGFAEYEWRLRLPNALSQPWPAPAWTGDHPAGSRVLVWNDQGMGDAIQYLRLTGRLADMGYRVLVLVQEQMKSLAASAPGVEAAFGPGDLPQAVDAHLPLCSLPHVLAVGAERDLDRAVSPDLEKNIASRRRGRPKQTRRSGLGRKSDARQRCEPQHAACGFAAVARSPRHHLVQSSAREGAR